MQQISLLWAKFGAKSLFFFAINSATKIGGAERRHEDLGLSLTAAPWHPPDEGSTPTSMNENPSLIQLQEQVEGSESEKKVTNTRYEEWETILRAAGMVPPTGYPKEYSVENCSVFN